MFKFKLISAEEFIDKTNKLANDELKRSIHSYVSMELERMERSQFLNDAQYLVLYVIDEEEQIVGFRSFYLDKSNKTTSLFGLFVNKSHRRLGVGKELILRSIYFGKQNECIDFKIILTEPTPAKDALYNFYINFAKNEPLCIFDITYWEKQIKISNGQLVSF
jgi:GNAT superfamily N-acetyltransferase